MISSNQKKTVTLWAKMRIDKFVDKEISSYTQVKQEHFQSAIDQFAIQMKWIKKYINFTMEDKQK